MNFFLSQNGRKYLQNMYQIKDSYLYSIRILKQDLKIKLDAPLKEDLQMAKNFRKRCLVPLVFKERHIKTTMRYHHTSVEWLKFLKFCWLGCWQGCEGIRSLIHCWWECKMIGIHWKPVWQFFLKLKIHILHDSRIPPRCLLKRNESIHLHKVLYSNV